MIDQDAVFVSGSSGGKVTLTPPFSDFCREQNLKLWVCHKHDPESKGPVENTVGFVKKNFFSARTFTCVEDVWRSLPGWLARKNSRIHQATLRVPKTVFESEEKKHLQPLLPSVYEKTQNTFKTCHVGSLPYVLYQTNKYALPPEYAYQTVQLKAAGGKLYIYNIELNLICIHTLSRGKGNIIRPGGCGE